MVPQAKHLIPVIEDAVQLWHFVQISRKYGSLIANDADVLARFIARAELVKEKHMTLARERESLDEILEELEEIKVGTIKPKAQPKINVITRPEIPAMPIKEVKLSEKPYALLRDVHSLMIEMDARLRKIETKLSNDH